jgi:hypothetical protein
MRHTWWHTHQAFGLNAKLVHAHRTRLPAALRPFDIAVLASILLHAKNPHDIIVECASRANTVVVVEPFADGVEGRPVMQFEPTAENKAWAKWWQFSTVFFTRFFEVLGFRNIKVTRHEQFYVVAGVTHPYFTVVARRG